jgi:hypothetical protein
MGVIWGLVDWFNSIGWGHDNVIAAATVSIAILNFILAFGTIFLWLSTRSLVNESKLTSKRQLRAYVFIDRCRMEVITTDAGRDFVLVDIAVKNYGNTPAYKFTSQQRGAIIKSSETPVYQTCSASEEGRQGNAIIGPGGETNFSIRIAMNDIHMSVIRRREKIVHVWGRYDYVDTFGEARYCDFFLKQGNWEPPGLWSLVPAAKSSEGN